MTGKDQKIKAWRVYDRGFYRPGVVIVFAETSGKARYYALGMDEFEDLKYSDMAAARAQNFDRYYKSGKRIMDWNAKEDRIALVKNGFFCLDPDVADDCMACPASKWCEFFKDYCDEYLYRVLYEKEPDPKACGFCKLFNMKTDICLKDNKKIDNVWTRPKSCIIERMPK